MNYTEDDATGAALWLNFLNASEQLEEWLEERRNPRPQVAGFQLSQRTTTKGRNLLTLMKSKQLRATPPTGVKRPAPEAVQSKDNEKSI